MTSTFNRLSILLFSIFISVTGITAHCKQSAEPSAVLPPLTGVSLRSEGNLYWLEFNTDAAALWPRLIKFWSTEDIGIKTEQPTLGYMETEWINDYRLNKFRSVLLSDKAPEFRERFRLRMERMPDNTGTRVFIYHTSYGILLDDDAVYSGYLPPSPQLEIEMLSRLALFSGANKNKIEKTVTNYKPTPLVAQKKKNNTYEIRMAGTTEFVYKKVIQTLERMDIQIKENDDGTITATRTAASSIDTSNAEKEDVEWEIDDSSDLEESGFSLWGNSTDKQKKTNTLYTIKLTTNGSDTLIHISDQTGNDQAGTEVEIQRFSDTVAHNLKK